MTNAFTRWVWMDLEMTGLDPDTDNILEIATLITDENLEIIARGPVIAVQRDRVCLSKMNDWNVEHHTASGLVDRVLSSKITIGEADEITRSFILQHVEAKKSPLCGNSIWQDRRFVVKEMPLTNAVLHYRNIDVSSVKELAKTWYPNLAPFKKQNSHTALEDICESVAELKYYREHIFKS